MRNPVRNFWQSLLHNRRHFVFAVFRRLSFLMPNNKLYLRIYYWLEMRQPLNLTNPVLFNEKLQWLKLYDCRPEYCVMADKFAVKPYVAKIIGDEYIIPTIGDWDTPYDIDWDTLPDSFVLKTNHDGGGNGIVICRDKSSLDKKKAINTLLFSWRRNTYRIAREWSYKNIRKKILAEPYMEDNKSGELRDYKFFCFDGVPKVMFVVTERGVKEKANFDFFDMDFNHLEIYTDCPVADYSIEKPASFEEMKEIAAKLSKGIPFVRVDLYEINDRPYFGEFTFYHSGGTGLLKPDIWNRTLGDWITLPSTTKQQ